jgi:hypothetical protein
MPVSTLILQEKQFLKKLSLCKSNSAFNKLIENATTSQLLCIIEIVFNILKNRVNFTSPQKAQLKKYAKTLRTLASTRSPKNARNLLIQHGGSLPIALILAPILAEIAKTVIDKLF